MTAIPSHLYLFLATFQHAFNAQTFDNALVLACGAILATGARTVTACLRAAGRLATKHFSSYHGFLSRAHFDQLVLARNLARLIDFFLPAGGLIVVAVDETLVRRYGPWVFGKGMHRDAVRSSKSKLITCSGHKWVTLAIVVRLPYMTCPLALPVLSTLYLPKRFSCRDAASVSERNQAKRRSHRTPSQLALALVRLLEGFLPHRGFVLLGDGGYGHRRLAFALRRGGPRRTRLLSRLPMNAALYAPPPPRRPGTRGRPPLKGERRPRPCEHLASPQADWQTVELDWYGGERIERQLLSGEALWYGPGIKPAAIRYVIVRDPEGKHRDECFFTTELKLSAREIVELYVLRFAIEVTFEQVREHLGLEGLRNHCENAIERSVPLLLGLYSLVVVWASQNEEQVRARGAQRAAAWYEPRDFCFGDLLGALRHSLLTDRNFMGVLVGGSPEEYPERFVDHLLHRLEAA